MGKDSTQTTTQAVDPATKQYIEEYRRRAAQAYGSAQQPWANPYTSNVNLAEARGMYGQAAGNLGLASRQFGGQADLQNFMNPYQQQVTGAVQANFDRQRQGALSQAGGQAAGAHAYGGSRSGILQAQALNDVNQNETGTLANLNRQGYADAMQAYQSQQDRLGNLGLGAAQGLNSIGQFQAQGTAQLNQAQQQYLAQLLAMQQGGFQPTSQTNSQTQQGNLWGDLLGAGLTVGGALIGGPAGAAAGASIGGAARGGSQSFNPPQFGSSMNLGFNGGSPYVPPRYDRYAGQY